VVIFSYPGSPQVKILQKVLGGLLFWLTLYISQHPPGSAFLLQQPQHGLICVQQRKATSSSRTVRQSDMDKEVSSISVGIFGTHFHWQFAITDSVLRATKIRHVLSSTMIHSQRLRDSLGSQVFCANINVVYTCIHTIHRDLYHNMAATDRVEFSDFPATLNDCQVVVYAVIALGLHCAHQTSRATK